MIKNKPNSPLAKSAPATWKFVLFGLSEIIFLCPILFMFCLIWDAYDIKEACTFGVMILICSMFYYIIGRQLPIVTVHNDHIKRVYPLLFGYRRIRRFAGLYAKSIITLRVYQRYRGMVDVPYLWLIEDEDSRVVVSINLKNQKNSQEIFDAIPLPYVEVENPTGEFSYYGYLMGMNPVIPIE